MFVIRYYGNANHGGGEPSLTQTNYIWSCTYRQQTFAFFFSFRPLVDGVGGLEDTLCASSITCCQEQALTLCLQYAP